MNLASSMEEFFEAAEAAEEEKKDRGYKAQEQQDGGSGSVGLIRNLWNAFQSANKGKGWSMEKMREELHKWWSLLRIAV